VIHHYLFDLDPTTFNSCGAAFDLSTNGALASYNPGWDPTTPGNSDWVSAFADGNRYHTEPPGYYVFRTSFTIPTGSTSPSFDLRTLGDNAVAVYLNGHLLGSQTVQDCPTGFTACNWMIAQVQHVSDATLADFNFGATPNLVDVVLIDTPIGWPAVDPSNAYNGTSCTLGPQASSPLPDKLPSQGGTWDKTTCLNPGAVNFWGSYTYTPQEVFDRGCSPGYWKNHAFAFSNPTVNSSTKVRTRSGLVSISSVHKGDKVFVVASAGKALRILDRQS